MRKLALVLFLALAPVASAQAQSMRVSTFLAKAEALKKQGPLALLSSDLELLKSEANNSAKAYLADVSAARKAGKLTHSCPPAKFGVKTDELLGHFNSLPPAQRNMSVKSALYGLMAKKFPCPK